MRWEDRIERLRAFAAKSGIEGTLGVRGFTPAFTKVTDPNDGAEDYIAIANTADIDLDDEVVVPGGADLTYINKNRQLFADHVYDLSSVAGSIRYFKAYPSPADHSAWQVRIKLNSTPIGQTARTIIRETGHIGLSIGFMARDYGPPSEAEVKAYSKGGKKPRSIVRAWDWFELSVTALPCNVSCQTGAVVTNEKRLVDLVELVRKGTLDRACAAALGIPVEPERRVFRVHDISTGVTVTKAVTG